MIPKFPIRDRSRKLWLCVVAACLGSLALSFSAVARTMAKPASDYPSASAATTPKVFPTPQQAADALVEAADNFDVGLLDRIFGRYSKEIVFTGEPARDRQLAKAFAAEAREKQTISVDPQGSTRAFLLVGKEDWPFPVPIVKRNNGWAFDPIAGRRELIDRRVGRDELDAIEICHGYVEAQHEYALRKRQGYDVHQYAQRIISSPGKQDGLAWRNSDGTWGGPIGENIALAIQQGYTTKTDPYHGYYFKVLKGQGPAAPLGKMDFIIEGVMIGGFALVAAPAEYGVTGVKTFIVSNDGIVYEKDFGPDTLNVFRKMERFNPDKTWSQVKEQ